MTSNSDLGAGRFGLGGRHCCACSRYGHPYAFRDEVGLLNEGRLVELAEDLNARITPLEGERKAAALSAFVRAQGINHMVLGAEKRGPLARLLRPSAAEELVAISSHVDVHLVSV